MSILNQRSLGQQIADELRGNIVQGQFQPGQEIRQQEIAERFGTSRMPVREALQILVRDGLLIAQSNRRTVVAHIDNQHLKDHYSVRALIEEEAARLCTIRAPELEELRNLNAAMEEYAAAGDRTGFAEQNEAFHSWIWHQSNNTWITHVAESLWQGIGPQTPGIVPTQYTRAVAEHRDIIDAIASGVEENAAKTMRAHIMSSCERLLNFRTSK